MILDRAVSPPEGEPLLVRFVAGARAVTSSGVVAGRRAAFERDHALLLWPRPFVAASPRDRAPCPSCVSSRVRWRPKRAHQQRVAISAFSAQMGVSCEARARKACNSLFSPPQPAARPPLRPLPSAPCTFYTTTYTSRSSTAMETDASGSGGWRFAQCFGDKGEVEDITEGTARNSYVPSLVATADAPLSSRHHLHCRVRFHGQLSRDGRQGRPSRPVRAQ